MRGQTRRSKTHKVAFSVDEGGSVRVVMDEGEELPKTHVDLSQVNPNPCNIVSFV